MNSFIRFGLISLWALLGFQSNAQQKDSVSKKQKAVETVDFKSNKTVTISYHDGTSENMPESEANKKGLIHNGGYGNQITVKSLPGEGKKVRINSSGPRPLYVLNGKEITEEEMKAITPSTIESINVLKDTAATGKYGVKGRNGVVEIILKINGNEKTYSDKNVNEDNSPIFQEAEVPALVDLTEWRKFLEKHTLSVAEELSKKAPAGRYTAYVRFIVEKNGTLSNFEITKDPGYGMGEKILALMKFAPKWRPAIRNGKTVRSYHIQPINLVLGDN